jgi:poly-D-alanine transfer protein DltD
MSTYKIKFKLSSFYDDEKYNLETIVKHEINAKDLEDLEKIVDDSGYMDSIDNSPVINKDTDSYPNYISIDYIEIKDEHGNLLYEEQDEYSSYLLSDTLH